MAYIFGIAAAIALIWWLLIVGLKKISDSGYPPEIKFPETEWPEMKKRPADQGTPINPSNVSNQNQGSTQ